MFGQAHHKEVRLHLDPSLTHYCVQAEYDVWYAGTDEEEERLTTIAYQQVDTLIQPYLEQGWRLDGVQKQSILLERRIVEKEGSLLRGGYVHTAAIVGAKVRLRR